MGKTPELWAILEYSTRNIGDDIQSLAARRFLPQIDFQINRDHIGEFHSPNGQQVGLIANGWYMHSPYAWPPTDPALKVLPISMHLATGNPLVEQAFESAESLRYLRRCGPIGARDLHTLRWLERHDVDAYMSGCLTLTLQRDQRIPRADHVLAVDLSAAMVEQMRARTQRPIVAVSPAARIALLSHNERLRLAEFLLFLMQSSHSVVSTRLHTALPCLAFDTPCLLINNDLMSDGRFDGLSELLQTASVQEFSANGSDLFNIDSPPSSPGQNFDTFALMRQRLEETTRSFTGYDASEHGLALLTLDPAEWMKDPVFLSMIGKVLIESCGMVERYNKVVARSKEQRDALESELQHAIHTVQVDRQAALEYENTITELRTTVERSKEQRDALESELQHAIHTVQVDRQAALEYENTITALTSELQTMRNSRSYTIGRVFTSPWRMARSITHLARYHLRRLRGRPR